MNSKYGEQQEQLMIRAIPHHCQTRWEHCDVISMDTSGTPVFIDGTADRSSRIPPNAGILLYLRLWLFVQFTLSFKKCRTVYKSDRNF